MNCACCESDVARRRGGGGGGIVIFLGKNDSKQATGLDAWASRVKCPARFVSHLHDICIYMSCS